MAKMSRLCFVLCAQVPLFLSPIKGETRVILRYGEDRFLQEVSDFALNGNLDMNITSRRLLSFTLRNDTMLQRLQQNENVEYIEEDQVRSALWFRDRLIPEILEPDREIIPYGIPMVQADQVWDLPPAREKMTICIVDSGMDSGHRDLPGINRNDVFGISTEYGNWSEDFVGHGTHTAGTIGAVGDNNIGIAGVNQDPNVFVLRVGRGLDDEGRGSTSVIIEAIQGCVDNGARVVSLSLGGPLSSLIEKRFYADLWDEGVLVIAAAGNEGNSGHYYPASLEHVMSVVSINSFEWRSYFSQCNSQVEIAAPGEDILSTQPNQSYAIATGTGMACPHVSGVAVQIWSRFPECSNAQIRNVLLRTARHLGSFSGCTQDYGWGLVQSRAAYNLLQDEGCEAGGDFQQDAKGGCPQNPDYVKEEHPNIDRCSGEEEPPVFLRNLLICVFLFVFAVGMVIFIHRRKIRSLCPRNGE